MDILPNPIPSLGDNIPDIVSSLSIFSSLSTTNLYFYYMWKEAKTNNLLLIISTVTSKVCINDQKRIIGVQKRVSTNKPV